jgi:hypothetical protein
VPDIVIQAENLGKKYTTGHQAENGRYVTQRGEFAPNYGIIETRTDV